MSLKELFLVLFWTQTSFAQSCNRTATFSLVSSPFKTMTYDDLSSSNCSSGTGPFDFKILNPSSRQFAYYASQGRQCYDYYLYGVYYYDGTYSNPNGTNASFVSNAQVPCILYPCCVILQCKSSLGCPNLTLNALWANVPRSIGPPFNYIYYVYIPGAVVLSTSTIVLIVLRVFHLSCLCLRCFVKEDEKPELIVPIVPVDTEETPIKIRKPRRATIDGNQ